MRSPQVTHPAVKDSGDDAAVSVQPCAVTQEQAAAIPGIEERVAEISQADEGTTLYDLYCKN